MRSRPRRLLQLIALALAFGAASAAVAADGATEVAPAGAAGEFRRADG